VKHLIVAGVLFAAAGDAVAQVSEVHTRWGASGSHVNLPLGTQTFGYEATVTGTTAPFTVKFEVYHNATLKFTDTKLVPAATSPYLYSCSVGMGTWSLCAGDTVTFVLRVIDTASGATLATHYLFGDVAGT
jgi:hypothetical protein